MRKIPRRNHHRNPARNVLMNARLARHRVSVGRNPPHLPRVIIAKINRLGDVRVAFHPRLAGFKHLQRRQFETAPAASVPPRAPAPARVPPRWSGSIAQTPRARRAMAASASATPAFATRPTTSPGRAGLIETISWSVHDLAPADDERIFAGPVRAASFPTPPASAAGWPRW